MKKILSSSIIFTLFAASLLFTGCAPKVKNLGLEHDLRIGVAASSADIVNPSSITYFDENCSILTYENAMKWVNLRPNKKFWNWTPVDSMVTFCEKRGMKIKWHTLFWHQQNSSFVNNMTTKEEALALMDEHIDTIMTRYKGKISEYDVLNEIFNEDGTLRQNIWYKLIGEEYIEHALWRATQADPSAKLYINDYSNECAGEVKADAMYEFIKSLKERNIPLDGVGLQLHLDARYPYNEELIRQNIRRYADLGLDVSFSEVDVRIPLNDREAYLEKQKEIYSSLMKLAVEEPNVKSFITWGWTDAHSWIDSNFPGCGEALLCDAAGNPKEVYKAVVDQLKVKR